MTNSTESYIATTAAHVHFECVSPDDQTALLARLEYSGAIRPPLSASFNDWYIIGTLTGFRVTRSTWDEAEEVTGDIADLMRWFAAYYGRK